MKQPFATLELREAVERALGFRLQSLERLPGKAAWSLNFKAVRADDGLAFVVKLVPDTGVAAYEVRFAQAVRHLADLEGTKAARLLFSDQLTRFGDYHVCCLSWCHGVRLFPDRLTVEQVKAFLDDYLAFSKGMQRTVGTYPKRDGLELRMKVLGGLRGFFCRPLRARIEADMGDENVVHRPELTRVIHGDFHYGNFLFANGRLSGIFDLEEFRQGYPAEDVVRYVTCAIEHFRWYELWRIRKIKRIFADMVAYLPYSAHEWTVALNVHFLRKAFKRVRDGMNLLKAMNLSWRYSCCRELREIAGRKARSL